MSNFALRSRQEEDRIKWNREKRKQLAAFFFDVSKLFIGGWVVGAVIQFRSAEFFSKETLLIFFGIITSVISALIGKTLLR